MPAFKLTAKRTIGSNDIPKGTTFQVLTANGTGVDANKIKAAIKQTFGKDLPESY
ncbi:MAG: hypothetical protein K2J82_09470 [Muribaculaceae bacterium]|nr:hypothetical protein [Muribaculaceae bacterium]